MSPYNDNSYKKRKKNQKKSDVYIALILLCFAIIFIPLTTLSPRGNNSYIRNVAVIKVTIVGATSDGDVTTLAVKPAPSQDVSGLENFLPSAGNLTIEIPYDTYFSRFMTGDNTKEYGALLSQVDEYSQKGLFVKTQKFIGSTWVMTDIYDTYEDAVAKNPEKSFEAEATVTKMHVTKAGDSFFVLEYDGRTFTLLVTAEQFKKAQIGSKFKCSFTSIGQMTKIGKIVE